MAIMQEGALREAGVDVGKDWLDACVQGGAPFRVPNTPEGCRDLAERLPAGCRVHLEASGGYERALERALRRSGREPVRHDPFKARCAMRARGRSAKTDALDARALAESGSLAASPEPKSESRQALCDLTRTLWCLKEASAEMKRRAALPDLEPSAKEALLAASRDLARRARGLWREVQRAVAGSKAAEERSRLARSVPGVGPATAAVLLAEMPEDLSAFTCAQLCAYAGVAPLDDRSGKRQGRARVQGGNSHLKRALYMPAVTLLRRAPWAKSLYARLRAKGRCHQQAIVAVMRRLMTQLAQVLKRGTPWSERKPQEPRRQPNGPESP